MSFPTLKKSIFALQLLGAAAIASFVGIAVSPSLSPSQIGQNTEAGQTVAYRASGRFEAERTIAYRASGRFDLVDLEANDTLAYRGSERGVDSLGTVHSPVHEAVAYRASGRLNQNSDKSNDSFGGAVAYRASGRFGVETNETLAYRGSERGVETFGTETVAYRASGRFNA